MANTIEVIIKATDQASTIIDKVEANITTSTANASKAVDKLTQTTGASAGGFSKMQAALVTANQAIDLIGRGFGYAQQAINATIGTTVAYAKEVRDLSTNLGISVEETSKVIQAADDYGISVGEVTGALQMAVKRGFAPNIDTLAKLADEYNSIQDPIQRAARLTDVFGRNWTVLTPMLKEGGQAIREAAAEAEKLGLVLNDKDVKSARALEVQIDNLNDRLEALKVKMGTSVIPGVVSFTEALDKMIRRIEGSEDPLDTLRFYLEHAINIFGKGSREVTALQQAIDEYERTLKNATGTVDAVDRAQQRAADSSAEWAKELYQAQLAPTYDAVDRAIRRTADSAAALQKQIAAAAAQKFVLDVGISGRLVNETKQYTQSQADLQKRLKETAAELRDLESKQGAVSKTTVKNAMSTNELALANARLADMQGRLSKETDPAKQAELAAQIGIQQDKINGANDAVSTYIDNSKRIEELKSTYDDLTKEIDATAAAHEEANKRILYDYAQQAIAQENARNGIAGMTEDQVNALNKLAVQFGIKSQVDIDTMNQIALAAKQLGKNSDAAQFAASAYTAFKNAEKPLSDFELHLQDVRKTAESRMGGAAKAIQPVTEKVEQLRLKSEYMKRATDAGGTSLQSMDRYGVQPLKKSFDDLNASVLTFNTLIGQMPTTIPTPTLGPLPMPTTGGGDGRTRPLPGGAQHGLTDFIVPPNPRGGSGDYFPIMFSPGERVNATPQGQRGGMAGLNIGTVNINVRDTNATAQQIEAAVYRGIDDVFKSAMRQAR